MPSTAFCLLYKLFCQGMSQTQLHAMLANEDSPFIRAIGFLYIRYVLPNDQLWEYCEPYLDDQMEIVPGADKVTITLGKFVRNLLSDQMYFATILPRIREKDKRDIDKKLLERELKAKRGGGNEKLRSKFKEGMRVSAQYSEDKKWYPRGILDVVCFNFSSNFFQC
jgi:pre-mRNA-splicing factor 38B